MPQGVILTSSTYRRTVKYGVTPVQQHTRCLFEARWEGYCIAPSPRRTFIASSGDASYDCYTLWLKYVNGCQCMSDIPACRDYDDSIRPISLAPTRSLGDLEDNRGEPRSCESRVICEQRLLALQPSERIRATIKTNAAEQ
jgi:hypothetical protein